MRDARITDLPTVIERYGRLLLHKRRGTISERMRVQFDLHAT